MLGKLLKYDFRSMGKQFAFVWPAVLVLALVNRFTFGGLFREGAADIGLPGQMATGVTFLVYWAVILATMVLTLVFIIQRFFKGLLGADLLGFWPELFRALGSQGVNGILAPLELLLLALAALAQCCLQMYLAMAIGHLFGKNRIAMSVVAYLAINIVMSSLFSTAAASFAALIGEQVTELINQRMEASVWGVWHSAVGLMLLGSAAAAAIYFFFTERILRRRLNLE